MLHVPRPLPIDPFSDALLLAAVLGLGGWLMVRLLPDPVTARRDRTATVLVFVAASYWLGRSHPNNVCNLAPFLVRVALRALEGPTGARSLFADVTAFGLATSVAALALSLWHSVPYAPRATVNIHTLRTFAEPDIERIRGQIANPEGPGVADFGPISATQRKRSSGRRWIQVRSGLSSQVSAGSYTSTARAPDRADPGGRSSARTNAFSLTTRKPAIRWSNSTASMEHHRPLADLRHITSRRALTLDRISPHRLSDPPVRLAHCDYGSLDGSLGST